MKTSPLFKIQDAYRFAAMNGLDADAKVIKEMKTHPGAGKPAVVRKGYLVELFQSRGLLEKFATEFWTALHTPSGIKKRSYYLNKKTLNERLLKESSTDDEETDFVESEISEAYEESSFSLEAQLRDFIAENLTRIPVNGRRLKLYSDEAGNNGIEYPTGVGPIDILAVDESGDLFVFELKLDRGPDRALGQLARYMGWMKVNLAKERNVFGVIVAKIMDERLKYAVKVFPNVFLLEYEVQFRLHEAGLSSDTT